MKSCGKTMPLAALLCLLGSTCVLGGNVTNAKKSKVVTKEDHCKEVWNAGTELQPVLTLNGPTFKGIQGQMKTHNGLRMHNAVASAVRSAQDGTKRKHLRQELLANNVLKRFAKTKHKRGGLLAIKNGVRHVGERLRAIGNGNLHGGRKGYRNYQSGLGFRAFLKHIKSYCKSSKKEVWDFFEYTQSDEIDAAMYLMEEMPELFEEVKNAYFEIFFRVRRNRTEESTFPLTYIFKLREAEEYKLLATKPKTADEKRREKDYQHRYWKKQLRCFYDKHREMVHKAAADWLSKQNPSHYKYFSVRFAGQILQMRYEAKLKLKEGDYPDKPTPFTGDW